MVLKTSFIFFFLFEKILWEFREKKIRDQKDQTLGSEAEKGLYLHFLRNCFDWEFSLLKEVQAFTKL